MADETLVNNFKDWHGRFQRGRVSRLNEFIAFVDRLEKDDMFDARAFRLIRARTRSQAEWAALIGVAQGTVGNWERGITYPNRSYRTRIVVAARDVLETEKELIRRTAELLGVSSAIDPIETQKDLQESILRAALTDFDYDPAEQKIVAIPFANDDRFKGGADFEADRLNLISSLAAQADMLVAGLSRGINGETDGLIQYLEKYRDQCMAVPVNPRLIHRLGEILSKRFASEDLRTAISGWDDAAFDGFASDHLELMRMYYREALAKAQEIEAVVLDEEADAIESRVFYDAAEMIEKATNEDGLTVFDEDIPTLLRDIGKEVRDLKEAIDFTFDASRRETLNRRRREAIKNGSVFIGRVLFFSSLFVVMVDPPSLGVAGSVASIFGLIEAAVPGSILAIYERFRAAIPILPRLGRGNAKSKE